MSRGEIVDKANDGCDHEALENKAHESAEEIPSIQRPTREKKPYKKPELTCYGNVTRLTAGINGTDFRHRNHE
jgi:hypothetical protein